ncbi:hypothetical protein ANN_20046 [Periplaneta americana]|uniref:Uncharacterized protein n=1 Tax=Periplaneta americana TaxID=6978 RepID=A0ABQ8SBT8_PERAM|nr:hypothetical protein ANN_20046 [Periplaneta americana]
MAGLCEGGNEPPGSLNASKKKSQLPASPRRRKPNGRALVQVGYSTPHRELNPGYCMEDDDDDDDDDDDE